MLHLRVTDNGNGLACEHEKDIFDKSEQVELKMKEVMTWDSDLGLAFCKVAVEVHGGIWVESKGKD